MDQSELLLEHIGLVNDPATASEQRKQATTWLQAWQREPNAARFAFDLLNTHAGGGAASNQSTPPRSAVASDATSPASSSATSSVVADASQEIPVLMFCVQTLSIRLKQVLSKPLEMKAGVMEDWMPPVALFELVSKLKGRDYLRGTLATCLGHSVVIQLCLSADGLKDVLDDMLQGVRSQTTLALNAVRQGALDNAVRLLSAPHDNILTVKAFSESLRAVSADPSGRLRQFALEIATAICFDDVALLVEEAAWLAIAAPAVFRLAVKNLIDTIEIVEGFEKAWSSFVTTTFRPAADAALLKGTYLHLLRFQARLIKFMALAPAVLVSSGPHTKIVGTRELSTLQVSLTALTQPLHSAVRQLLNMLRAQRNSNRPSPFSDNADAARGAVLMSLEIGRTATAAAIDLRPLVERRISALQYVRSINGLAIRGPVANGLAEFDALDQKITAAQREVLERTLNSLLTNSSQEWWAVTRSDAKSSTPQELLLGERGFMEVGDLSSGEESDMSEEDCEPNSNCWLKFESNCVYALAAYARWVSNLVHSLGPLYAFGAILTSVNATDDCSVLYSQVYSQTAGLGVSLITAPDGPSISAGQLKEFVRLTLWLGLPERSLVLEEGSVIDLMQLSPSLVEFGEAGREQGSLAAASAPSLSPLQLKSFGVGFAVAPNDDSKLDYDYAYSTLNDAINNAMRDYGAEMHAIVGVGGDGSTERFALIELILQRSLVSACYPLNFDRVSSKLKKWFIEHRDEVKRNLKCWCGALGAAGVGAAFDSAASALLRGPQGKSWRCIEFLAQGLGALATLDPDHYTKYLKEPELLARAREHRAVLRQYMIMMTACSRALASSGDLNNNRDFLRSALLLCRAALRVPQADSCYPLSSMQDHIGAVTLAKILSNLTEGIPDADPQTIITLHEDALFLMKDATERACNFSVHSISRGQCCWLSMHSFTSLAYCCGRYLSFAHAEEATQTIAVSFTQRLFELINQAVTLLIKAPPPLPGLEAPAAYRLLSYLIKDLTESLAIYVGEIMPAGTGPSTNILRLIGMQPRVQHPWGSGPATPANLDTAKDRCGQLCQRFPELVAAATPILSDHPELLEAFGLLSEALLSSALVVHPALIGSVVSTVGSSPLISCLEFYLKALRSAERSIIETSMAALDILVEARLRDALSLARCNLSRSHELALISLALTKFFRLRYSLYQDVPIGQRKGHSVLEEAFGVALLAILAYTHFTFCNPTSEQLTCPTEALGLIADLLDQSLGDHDLSVLGPRFIQGVHNLVSDTQLKAATKGSAKSRESITPSPPSPTPLLEAMTPTAPSTELRARTAATVALMTLISAQDSCSSISSIELNATIDLAPRILDTTSVDAAARYLARALPFNTNGVPIPAAPYKWAASEDAIKQFVDSARTASSIRKTIKNYCALLNVVKRRGSRGSSSLLSPQQ